MGEFQDAIINFAKKKRNRIGIPILRVGDELLNNLEKASELVDIIVFGKEVSGYDCNNIKCNSLEDEANVSATLFRAYNEKKIDGFIRGHLKYDQFYNEMQRTLGKKYE